MFASIFIVELAPERLRRLTIPVIRLLASVPSVVYGLIGVLVLVPFVGNHLVTASEKASVANTIELTGAGLLVTVVILTVMIAPIMIALTCEALASVPSSWREGAIALGLNPLRAILAVTVRAARPAIVAAAVLATARALGEAIMISMVSGGRAFTPNLDHGLLIFLYSPLRTFASTIVDFREGISAPALGSSLYAIALLLLLGGVRAVGLRLSDQAAAAQVPGARMSTLVPFEFDEPRVMQTGRGRRSSPMSWRWRDRLALVLAWVGRDRAVPDRGRDRDLLRRSRGAVPAPEPAVLAGRRSRPARPAAGGFLDPLLGTVILTFVGIVLALPLAVTSAVWMSEYARPTLAGPDRSSRASRSSPAPPTS